MSEVQQQLLDINQRYEIVGERLGERQHELQASLKQNRAFTQDVQDLLAWMDERDAQMAITADGAGIPASEREAKRQLKEHEV